MGAGLEPTGRDSSQQVRVPERLLSGGPGSAVPCVQLSVLPYASGTARCLPTRGLLDFQTRLPEAGEGVSWQSLWPQPRETARPLGPRAGTAGHAVWSAVWSASARVRTGCSPQQRVSGCGFRCTGTDDGPQAACPSREDGQDSFNTK